MNKRIIYKAENDKLSVLTPSPYWEGTLEELAAKDLPAHTEWTIVDVDKFPADKFFVKAWELQNGKVTINIDKAKEIWRECFRSARTPILMALDVDYMRADESNDVEKKNEIIAKKQLLRNITSLELPDKVSKLKTVWPQILGPKPSYY